MATVAKSINTALNSKNTQVTIAYSDQIARSFEEGRKDPDPVRVEHIARLINNHVNSSKTSKLLDLGCGTGFFTIPLSERLNCRITGVDRSVEMLEVARAKTGQAKSIEWLVQDAAAMSFDNETFDVVFMSNFLHHFNNPLDVIEQCIRVLKPGGLLINHYGALEDIINDPDHKFFGEAIDFDVRRVPARIQMEYLFKTALLKDVQSQKKTFKLCNNSQERLKLVENKYVSVLHMVSEISYQRGLKEMRKYAAANQFDPWLRELTVTTTFGVKSK